MRLKNINRCIWCQRLLPTIEALAEALERDENKREITVGTVDCTQEKRLCTEVFNIRVSAKVAVDNVV